MTELTTRRLGNTGMEPKALGLGCAYFGGDKSSDRDTIEGVRHAIELGLDYVDTSAGYGQSERRVGLALEGGWRDRVHLQTKTGTQAEHRGDYSAATTRWSVENSLRLLKTDYLDSVLIHDPEDIERLGVPHPGEYAVLSVTDTGMGMDEATRTRIFEPFFTTKAAGKGTGLELAMVMGTVEQSGGHIVVDSSTEKGSCFQIYLPRSAAMSTMDTKSPGEASPLPRSGKILLVEDDVAVRRGTRRLLQAYGYEILDTGDPEEALTIADPSIDLLLTDIRMPGLDGRELADRLKKRFPELKVLLMSGYAEEMLSRESEDEKFLEKPSSGETMLRKISLLLNK